MFTRFTPTREIHPDTRVIFYRELQSTILLAVLACIGSAAAGATPLVPYGAAAVYEGGLAIDGHGHGAPVLTPAHGKLVYGAPAIAYHQPLPVYGGYYGGYAHHAGDYEHHGDDGHHGDYHVRGSSPLVSALSGNFFDRY